jgi:cyclin B
MQEKADVLQLEMLSWYLVELCLTEYSMVKFCPSQVAAAAVYMALNILVRETCCWGPALQLHSGYTESQLKYAISSLSSHTFQSFIVFLAFLRCFLCLLCSQSMNRTPPIIHHAAYCRECATMIEAFHSKAGTGSLTVVHKKYSNSRFLSVAKLSPSGLLSPVSSSSS